MSESRKQDQLMILKFFEQTSGWCGMRKLHESLPLDREKLMNIIHEMVEAGILVREIDYNTKKAWYHLPELTVQSE